VLSFTNYDTGTTERKKERLIEGKRDSDAACVPVFSSPSDDSKAYCKNVETKNSKLERHRARQKHQSINHHYRTKEKNKSERAIRKREKNWSASRKRGNFYRTREGVKALTQK